MATMTRRIVMVAFPDVQLLDVVGPLEVFSLAERELERTEYRLEIATVTGEDMSAILSPILRPQLEARYAKVVRQLNQDLGED